ncbi:MAG: PAS domain S-box protein [Gemmatimonadaceae bacterium]
MIDYAPEAIIVYNLEVFLYVNRFAAEQLECGAEQLVGQPILKYVHDDSRPAVIERIRHLARTGEGGPPIDVQFVSTAGRVIPAEVVSVPIVFDGQPAVLGFIRDTSRRREAERALRESEERFGNAFKYSPHGMGIVGLDGRWMRANRSLCQMLGYSPEELQALTVEAVTHPDDNAEDVGHTRSLISGETKSYDRVKRYFRKDGEMIWVSVAVSAVHNSAGEPMYLIGQVQDITAQREMEQRSLQAERLAGIVETTIAVAHEMNNVLTVLTMNAELLANNASPGEIPAVAAEILLASSRIAATVKRLRNVADMKSVAYLGDKKMLDLSTTPRKPPINGGA